MRYLAQTDFYELAYERENNRIHWKIKGYWPSVENVPDFHTDWKKAVAAVSSGFTVLADLREMKPAPQDVVKLHQKNQRELMRLGCRKAVQVSTNPVSILQINRVTRLLGMGKSVRVFDNFKDAKDWLDTE